MLSVVVIGAKGFVGTEVCKFINILKDYSLIKVARGDDIEDAISKSDVVIHAANPSKRFYAENNPEEDFEESVQKTRLIKKNVGNKKLILISSISARTELDTVYGRNRRECEKIVECKNTLIIRLGPMFGSGKNVGALNDLLCNNPVYVSGDTKYAYVNIKYNAQKIVSYINDSTLNGYIELGSKEGISLTKLKKIIGSSSVFQGKDDTQIPIDPPKDAPDVMNVVNYVQTLIPKMR
jgi:dTDP-4-dehydrorhamnose reductase